MDPPFDPHAGHDEGDPKRLDPGLVELVKALARSRAARDIADVRRRAKP